MESASAPQVRAVIPVSLAAPYYTASVAVTNGTFVSPFWCLLSSLFRRSLLLRHCPYPDLFLLTVCPQVIWNRSLQRHIPSSLSSSFRIPQRPRAIARLYKSVKVTSFTSRKLVTGALLSFVLAGILYYFAISMPESEKLFQDDPNFDESIQVTFPNGKKVPLGSINKPHARVPGITVPHKGQDLNEFYKEKNAKREEAQDRVIAQRKEQEEQDKSAHHQDGNEQQPVANPDNKGEPKKPEDVYVHFPNGKSVPLSKINKPHAPPHHPKLSHEGDKQSDK